MKNVTALMKKLCSAAIASACILSLAGCGTGNDISAADNTSTAVPTSDAEWNELGQEEITKAMGMGWDLGNQLEASNAGIPSETAWGNPVITEDLIKTVKEQGFNTVRIPVSYLLKIGAAPEYTIDKDWLDSQMGELRDGFIFPY